MVGREARETLSLLWIWRKLEEVADTIGAAPTIRGVAETRGAHNFEFGD